MSSIDQATKDALIASISGLVARLQATSGLTEAQVNVLIADYVTGVIADEATASAGVSTEALTSVRGAYLAAKKALEDELAANPAGLQTLADIGTAIEDNQISIGDLQDTLAEFVNVFNYVGEVNGGVDEETPFDLASLPEGGKDAGDYYDVATGGWFIVTGVEETAFEIAGGNGIVFKADGNVKVFNNQLVNVSGTADEVAVAGSKETGFIVGLAQAIKDRIIALEEASGAGEDLVVRSRLDVVGEAVAAADVLTAVRADARLLPLGSHVHATTATAAGIEAGADTEVTMTTHVIEVTVGEVVVNQTATWSGKSAVRSADTRVEDPEATTELQWSPWHIAQDEINELYDVLTQAFDEAAVE